MRWVVALGLFGLAGCRQILGFDTPVASQPTGDDAQDTDATLIDGPPADQPVVPSGRKKTITIDPTKVTGDQVAFPVFVHLTDMDLKAHARADGSDIHFTLTSGAFVPYEIEHWDPSSADLRAWVRLDVDNTVPTAFDIRYDEQTAAPPPTPITVFSNAFDAVWHLEDAAAVVDATNTHAVTAVGGPTTATGKLGNGVSFDGVDAKLTFVNTINGSGATTFSAWVSVMSPTNGLSSVITIGNSSQNQARYLHTKFTSGIGAGVFSNDHMTTQNIDNTGFRLLHWTLGQGVSRLYLDGQVIATDNTGFNNVSTSGTAGTIGMSPNTVFGNNANPLKGTLDEVRIATEVRSAGWIETEFANQSSPQTFYSVGPEQIVP